MGKKNAYSDFDPYDNPMLIAGLEDEELLDDFLVKPERHRARRKHRDRNAARNRFSDYEDERRLRRQVADWDDYDAWDDYDDNDFKVATRRRR